MLCCAVKFLPTTLRVAAYSQLPVPEVTLLRRHFFRRDKQRCRKRHLVRHPDRPPTRFCLSITAAMKHPSLRQVGSGGTILVTSEGRDPPSSPGAWPAPRGCRVTREAGQERRPGPGEAASLPAPHPCLSSRHFPRGSGVSEEGMALHHAWAATLCRCSQGQHQGHTLAFPGEPPGRAEPRVHAGQAASTGCIKTGEIEAYL